MFSPNQPFNLDAYLDEVMTFWHPEIRQIYADNKDVIRELARIICCSAARLRIKDHASIRNALSAFIEGSDILSYSEAYRPRILAYTAILNTQQTDGLLKHFFAEKNENVRVRMLYFMRYFQNKMPEKQILELPDWVGVYRLLDNSEVFFTFMDQLEVELQKMVAALTDEWAFPKRADGKFVLPTDNATCGYKVLSNFLYQWAQENDFQQRAKILNIVDSKTFYQLLVDASIFKDRGAGEIHGFWSHMLQWYAIFELHKKNPDYFTVSPMVIYQSFGKYSQGSAWNRMVDEISYGSCTSPEAVTRHLIENTERWPLLAGTVSRHQRKFSGPMAPTYEALMKKHEHDAKNEVVVRPFIKSKL